MVVGLLTPQQQRLRIHVGLEVGVPVQMVRGQVQDQRHVRPEGVRGLELERGDLEHRHVQRASHQPERGASDVAGGLRPQPRRPQHRRQQLRGRALAVGSGHRRHRHRERLGGELHVPGHPLRVGGPALARHTRARNHQVPVVQVRKRSSHAQRHALAQRLEALQRGGRALVRRHHARPALRQEGGGAAAAASQAQHEHASSGEIPHQRSFREERATSPRMIETIQKRTTICCSGQPFCS